MHVIMISGATTYCQICAGSFTCVVCHKDIVYAARPSKQEVMTFTRQNGVWKRGWSFSTSFACADDCNPIITLAMSKPYIFLCSTDSDEVHFHSMVDGKVGRKLQCSDCRSGIFICDVDQEGNMLLIDSCNNMLMICCFRHDSCKVELQPPVPEPSSGIYSNGSLYVASWKDKTVTKYLPQRYD